VTNNQTANAAVPVDQILDLVTQTRASINALPAHSQEAATPLLNELEHEARRPQPDRSALTKSLKSLATVCEGAGGNLLATGIGAGITSLLQHFS
jgi:hypothetical protein